MARKTDPETQEFYARIVQMRDNYPGIRVSDIAVHVGCNPSTVQSVLRAAGRTHRDNKRTRVPDAELPRISNLCVALGSVMEDYIRTHRDPASSPSQVARPLLLNRMRTGLHDFTMRELERIAAWMNVPVSDLMRAAEQRVISQGSIGGPRS